MSILLTARYLCVFDEAQAASVSFMTVVAILNSLFTGNI